MNATDGEEQHEDGDEQQVALACAEAVIRGFDDGVDAGLVHLLQVAQVPLLGGGGRGHGGGGAGRRCGVERREAGRPELLAGEHGLLPELCLAGEVGREAGVGVPRGVRGRVVGCELIHRVRARRLIGGLDHRQESGGAFGEVPSGGRERRGRRDQADGGRLDLALRVLEGEGAGGDDADDDEQGEEPQQLHLMVRRQAAAR